jgi:hypothetical protein
MKIKNRICCHLCHKYYDIETKKSKEKNICDHCWNMYFSLDSIIDMINKNRNLD